jgi:hypothetical protein
MRTPISERVVLHSRAGYRMELDAMVAQWILDGVKYVGVVGADASTVEDIIDQLCVGDGSKPYDMLTASHTPDETLQDAVLLASQLSGFQGAVTVVEL